MTTEYSVSIDWYEELRNNPDRWINHGRNALHESCKHKQLQNEGWCEKCDISEDSCEPMMNYGYPLHHEPTEEQKREVAKETSCTIMENQDSGDFFLVLCGGGMDLSQSIAHAYTICGYIPDALAFNVSEQYGLNISGETYFKVMAKIKNTLQNTIESYKNRIERIDEAVIKAKKRGVKNE